MKYQHYGTKGSTVFTTWNISNLNIGNLNIATVEFAFDLDSGLRSGKPTVRSLLPTTTVFLLKMHYAEIQGRRFGV
jgi:hypothetical protein